MTSLSEDIGKKAEQKIRQWLNRPEEGYDFNRIPDNMNGFYGSRNICDFDLYKNPNKYYIESKATYHDRFDFNMLTDYQMENMLKKSQIANVRSLVIVLFVTYQRAFIFDIRDIQEQIESGKKSVNITKIANWKIPYKEIRTIPSRKQMLDYEGEIEEYIPDSKDN